METHGPLGILAIALGLVLCIAGLAWLTFVLLFLIGPMIARPVQAISQRIGRRTKRRILATVGAGAALASVLAVTRFVQHESLVATEPSIVESPTAFSIPNNVELTPQVRAAVLRGRAIADATRDSLPGYTGNVLRCSSCHLDGGMRNGAIPWLGVYARFPQYRAREGKILTMADRVNGCLRRSMNGRALPENSREMRDLVAYMAYLSRPSAQVRNDGTQALKVNAPASPPDTARGRAVFALNCAACHGANGEGTTIATPLWGASSFNVGAGMARLRTAAAFIQASMPFNRPGTLAPGEAFDVAAYIVSKPRPDFVGKELDWPKGDAPPDAAYRTVGTKLP